ncbi:MAG: lasso peptide biosynthesis B2 protein [Thermoanaerobaculia bacterium]
MTDRVRRRLAKLGAMSWRDRFLLAEAVVWLAVARVALWLPFRWLAPRLGETMAESVERDGPENELGSRVAWAIGTASHVTPWATRCLAEAMAAKAMLRMRGVRTTLYLGMAKDERGEFRAHAWLRCGTRYLTGEAAMREYTVIAKFAESDLA